VPFDTKGFEMLPFSSMHCQTKCLWKNFVLGFIFFCGEILFPGQKEKIFCLKRLKKVKTPHREAALSTILRHAVLALAAWSLT